MCTTPTFINTMNAHEAMLVNFLADAGFPDAELSKRNLSLYVNNPALTTLRYASDIFK